MIIEKEDNYTQVSVDYMLLFLFCRHWHAAIAHFGWYEVVFWKGVHGMRNGMAWGAVESFMDEWQRSSRATNEDDDNCIRLDRVMFSAIVAMSDGSQPARQPNISVGLFDERWNQNDNRHVAVFPEYIFNWMQRWLMCIAIRTTPRLEYVTRQWRRRRRWWYILV